jgi:hypothetical protein
MQFGVQAPEPRSPVKVFCQPHWRVSPTGRLDHKIEVPAPNQWCAIEVPALNLSGLPTEPKTRAGQT